MNILRVDNDRENGKLRDSVSKLASTLEKQEIHISEEIYSSWYFKSFKVENLKLSVEHDKTENSKILKIEGIQSQKWLEEKYKDSLRVNSI